jgi:hypothetical protein
MNVERRKVLTPAFLLVAALLLLGAVGLNTAVPAMKLHFRKEAVPLRRPLTSLPVRMGHWVQVSVDRPLQEDVEEVLGTKEYIYRDYVDDRVVSASQIAEFQDKSYNERRGMLAQLQQEHPNAVVNLGITYYTGLVDTVAHIPDRCYIADGYEPTSYDIVSWPIAAGIPGRSADPDVQVRFINFQDQVGRTRLKRSVSYFFHVNGHFESDPLNVRRRLQNLLQKYGYYMKIETMTLIQNKEQSASVMQDFLTAVLPNVKECLPDWQKVNGR